MSSQSSSHSFLIFKVIEAQEAFIEKFPEYANSMTIPASRLEQDFAINGPITYPIALLRICSLVQVRKVSTDGVRKLM